MVDIGVLPGYTGTVVHDGYAPYELMTDAVHAQCAAHLVRHLRAVAEAPKFAGWAHDMISLLLEARTEAQAAFSAGYEAVDANTADDTDTRYRAIAPANEGLDVDIGRRPGVGHRKVGHYSVLAWFDISRA